MDKKSKMNKLLYFLIGFILGIITELIIFLNEWIGLNLKNLKKFWRLLNE
jgi:hypothetical protein